MRPGAITILAVALLAPSPALAATIAESFHASDFYPSVPGDTAPEDPVGGSYAVSFDEPALAGIGFEYVTGAVESISLTINGYSYTPAVLVAELLFFDGALLGLTLGPDAVPSGCGFDSSENTFCLHHDYTHDFANYFFYGTPSDGTRYEAESVQFQPVPEPSAGLAVGFGLALLSLTRIRSRRRTRNIARSRRLTSG